MQETGKDTSLELMVMVGEENLLDQIKGGRYDIIPKALNRYRSLYIYLGIILPPPLLSASRLRAILALIPNKQE